jgi:hypothetical protein
MMNFIYLFISLLISSTYSSNSTEESYFVFHKNEKSVKILIEQNLIVDHVDTEGFEVYGPKGTDKYLHSLNANYKTLDTYKGNITSRFINTYPSPEEIEKELISLQENNKDILRLLSIGKSKEGRKLYVVKISDNVKIDELEPEFKYVANMHGDEIVGREVLVQFIKDLLKRYRSGDQDIIHIVNSTEIFIMPSMNPDGANKKRRGNANNKDLNRDFPDFTTKDNLNELTDRQPETQAMMKWQAKRNFSLSANFHGGAVCVNYPWDTQKEDFPLISFVKELSLDYASNIPEMYNSTRFEDGITNGYKWYEVNGGMQDWSYYWYNDLQITVELSKRKWPNYSKIDQYYQDNSKSLFKYLSKVLQGNGFKLSKPNLEGSVKIRNALDSSVVGNFSFKRSEFYKVLPAGKYHYYVTINGEKDVVFEDEVFSNVLNQSHTLYKEINL